MLSWVVTFLVIALIAGVLGFGGVAGASVEIAKAIFFIAVVLFLISAVVGLVRGRGKVFAGFVVGLSSIGAVGIAAAILPLLMTVAITALEVLMAFIQAYVFTMLTCMYLNDALHPGH